jgi:hypothetical protein
MRTKTLLIAAAALAATVISSEAQTVYSANVVGYVNVTPASGVFSLIANPLNNGVGNVLSNTLVGAPGGTVVQAWNPSAGGFDVYKLQAGHWKNLTTLTNADNFTVTPGAGFFITPASPYTNTFVGTVVAPVGGSVTNTVQPGLQLVSSLIPYGDFVTNTATLNLAVAGGTTLQQWDPIGQQFVVFKFQAGHWVNLGTSLQQVPQIGAGEGFFLSPSTVANVWTENFTNQ